MGMGETTGIMSHYLLKKKFGIGPIKDKKVTVEFFSGVMDVFNNSDSESS